MTIKRYEKESFLQQLDTKILEIKQQENETWLRLAESIFFPEEGGQHADTGVLQTTEGEIQVLDGRIREGELWYLVQFSKEISIPQVDTAVSCILDWGKRFSRMQNHSGEHIFSGLVHGTYGFDNVGFHLSDDGLVTLDFNGKLTREQAAALEKEANRVIYENLPIRDTYPDKKTLGEMQYRSKIEIEGQVRIVTIGNEQEIVDVCACCAPHVHSTGQVGMLKVFSVAPHRGGTRIGILCGSRAFDALDRIQHIVEEAAVMLSVREEDLCDRIQAKEQEIMKLRGILVRNAEKDLLEQVETLAPGAGGCVFAESDFPMDSMKIIYNALVARGGARVGVFAGREETGYVYYAGIPGGDARELAKLLQEQLGAKGGGSAEMIQGRVQATKEQLQAFFGQ